MGDQRGAEGEASPGRSATPLIGPECLAAGSHGADQGAIARIVAGAHREPKPWVEVVRRFHHESPRRENAQRQRDAVQQKFIPLLRPHRPGAVERMGCLVSRDQAALEY